MANKKYDLLAEKVVELVGGKDNISFFTHCVTRLRFNVKDKGLVNVEEIEKLNGVIGSQWAGEQLQIIIGQAVGDVYALICKKHNFAAQDAVDEKLDNTKKKFSVAVLLDGIAGCVAPLIPILIGGGLLKTIVIVLAQLGILTATSPTYVTLTFVGDTAFYFLPVFAGAFAAKKFNTSVPMAMFLGAMLIHPTFISMVAEGSSVSIFGLPIYAGSYSSSIFPVILSVFIMRYVQRFFAKYSPEVIRSIVEPLGTLLVMTPLAFCVIAPLGNFLGQYLAVIITWLYDTVGFVTIALLAAFFPYIVTTGMHLAGTFPIVIQNFTVLGYDPIIMVSNFISNFNQAAVCVAVAVKTKNKELRSNALSCAVTAVVGGITEPAMFGITLKYRKAMYGSMVGGLVAGAFAGLSKVICCTIPGSAGMFGLVGFIGENPSNIVLMLSAIVIGMVVSFIATLVLYKNDDLSGEM